MAHQPGVAGWSEFGFGQLTIDHQEVPVLGPEDLSGTEMAAVISEVLGRPVRYQQVPGQAFRDQLTGHGISIRQAIHVLGHCGGKSAEIGR